MKELLGFIMNINHIYLVLVVLAFITSFVFLKVNNKKKLTLLVMLVYMLITLISFNYFDYLFNSFFSFSYSSIKGYLILLIVVNIITLVNVNCRINIVNKIINYMLFIISGVIFLINVFVIINNYFKIFSIEITSILYLINLNFIVFITYLFVNFITYLIYQLIVNIIKHFKKNNHQEDIVTIDDSEDVNFLASSVFVEEPELSVKHLDFVDSEKFIIDGKDCSFIFNDPNKDNVIKNYYILLTDVNARLVNGYTIDENIKINDILNRLNVKNINNLDLMNMEILSKITIDEFNLLKSYLDNCKLI